MKITKKFLKKIISEQVNGKEQKEEEYVIKMTFSGKSSYSKIFKSKEEAEAQAKILRKLSNLNDFSIIYTVVPN